MKRIVLITCAMCCALFFLTGQRVEEEKLTREEIIERGVRIKVEEFRTMQMRKCRERAVLAAETKVDSMIRAMAREMQIDPVPKPPKTFKPERPEVRQLPDTLRDVLQKKQKKEEQ